MESREKQSKRLSFSDILNGKNLKIAIVISLFFLYVFYNYASSWSENGIYGNIEMYVFSAVLYFIVLAISALVLFFLDMKFSIRISGKVSKIVALLILIVGGWFLVQCYNNELDKYAFPEKYFRHIIPGCVYLVILISFCGLAFVAIKGIHGRNAYWRCVFAFLTAFVQGWFLYAPNPFLDNFGSITHIDAYTNSILNTVANAPFEMYSSSIYGHHGLIYLVPIKLFHKCGFTYWDSLTITIAIIGFITFFVQYWCYSQVIRNDSVYTMAVLANAVVSFQIYFDQYYQMMPHRYLFQSLVIGGGILAYRKRNSSVIRKTMWIICGLSMIWNMETGIVVSLVWYLAVIYLDANDRGRYFLQCFLKNGIFLIIVFLAGYGIVNIYNLFVGGNTIDIYTYIYPIGSNSYPIEMLKLTLMKPNNGYFMAIALLLGIIGLYFIRGLFLQMDESQFAILLSSIMGVGVFTYYMNRAVTTNATIIAFSMVMVLSHFVDRSIAGNDIEKKEMLAENNNFRDKIYESIKIRNSIGVLCMVVLSGLALASVSTVGATVKNKIETTWNTDSRDEFIVEAHEKIPADAVAFGKYTAQLFALMDRTTGIYIADWEDMGTSWMNTIMNPEAFDKLEEMLSENQYEHIVVFSDQAEYLPQNQYSKVSDLEYNGAIFEVYERNGIQEK